MISDPPRPDDFVSGEQYFEALADWVLASNEARAAANDAAGMGRC